MAQATVSIGLEGVVAAATRLSSIDGQAGKLIIRGIPVEELAMAATFEETVYLLWFDRLPAADELAAFRQRLASQYTLPPATLDLLQVAARERVPVMDALRMAAGTLSLGTEQGGQGSEARRDAVMLVARFPTIVAAYWRLSRGEAVIAPDPSLGLAANYLYMLHGEHPHPEQVRGLETYLNTVIDHGLNASTFAARVIVATGTDLVSAIVGGIGALKGPLHGGAPGPALDMVFAIGEVGRAEEYLRAKLARGERLMGFGHRVYRVRDPRAEVLAKAAERFYERAGDMQLYTLARGVEQIAVRLLAEHRPGRNLETNVEFYTALLLHGLPLVTDLFTPTFAISRVAGWIAHCFEQQALNRIIRPQSVYVGPTDRKWVALEEREPQVAA